MSSARINGVDLGYSLSGPENAPLVVFSHSLGADRTMWDGLLPAFTARYRCLAYDTRGHGKSGSVDVAVGMDDLAADLAGLLDHIGRADAHIVGLSLGGMTGQALASRQPQRVRSLTLLATTATLPPKQFWIDRVATVRAKGPQAIVDGLIPRWFTPPFLAAHPEVADRQRRVLLSVGVAGYARCCAAIGEMDLRQRLGRIATPTLVIAGALDPVTPPAMAEELAAGIAGARLTIMPAVSHMLAVEKPAETTALVLPFIDRAEGAGKREPE